MDKKEEPAPEGYEWQDIKSFDENGKAIFKRELVKLEQKLMIMFLVIIGIPVIEAFRDITL